MRTQSHLFRSIPRVAEPAASGHAPRLLLQARPLPSPRPSLERLASAEGQASKSGDGRPFGRVTPERRLHATIVWTPAGTMGLARTNDGRPSRPIVDGV